MRKAWLPDGVRHAALAIAGALLLAAPAASSPAATAPAAQSRAQQTVAIPVKGMMCLSCAAAIKQEVKKLPGVSNVEVMFAKQSVRITYAAANQPNVPSRAVVSINALGYKAGTPAAVQ